MTVLLDAIRAEIEPLKQRLDTLREIEALALRLNGDGGGGADEPRRPTPSSAAAPARTSARPAAPRAVSRVSASPAAAGRDGLHPSAQRVLEAIRAHGEISPAALRDAVDLGRDTVATHVRTLLARNLIDASGTSRDRRLIAKSTGQPRGRRPTNANGSRHQPTTAPPGALREAVLAQLHAKPGTEPDLARRLRSDREDIAFTCGELLEQGAVILDPDGTYRRPGGAPASVATR